MKQQMINTATLYDRIYSDDLKVLKSLKISLSKAKHDFNSTWKTIAKSGEYFNRIANVKWQDVKSNIENDIAFTLNFSNNISPSYKTVIVPLLKKSKSQYTIVKAIRKEIVKKESEVPSLQVFKTIVITNNFVLRRKLIDGESVPLKGRMGFLEIIRNRSKNSRIDWGASNKFKAKLIKEGQTPYKVTERNDEGKPIKDNGGVPWFIYTDSINCWIAWYHKYNMLKNNQFFRFIPSAPFVQELNVERKSKNNVDTRYRIIDANNT